jgi:hypothetical protein
MMAGRLAGVEPVAQVSAGERGGRVGQRGRYGIDGGFAGPTVFGVMEAGLAGTVAWAMRHRKPAVAALAGVGGAAVVSGELPVLHWAGQAGESGAGFLFWPPWLAHRSDRAGTRNSSGPPPARPGACNES